MISAYSESYLNDAKQNLAVCFDYAAGVCQIEADLFAQLFVFTGYAEKFERGNPAIVAGMSGVELARSVLSMAYPKREFPDYNGSYSRSDLYWAGWALAEYQWTTCKRFRNIFSKVPFSEIVTMYNVYHEMSIEHFIEEVDRRIGAVQHDTKLKMIRENRGVSQSELARLSGVKLRSIQMYEQKINDIDKAQAGTVYKLSRVLGCSVEDLLENPEK